MVLYGLLKVIIIIIIIYLYNRVGDGGVCDIPHWIGGKVLGAI